MEHEHNIVDSGSPYIIDSESRSIITPATGEIRLVQYDHDSTRIAFRIPRMIENHDMSEADTVEIHYLNQDYKDRSKHNTDIYIVTDIHLAEDDNYAEFTWLVSRNATLFTGSLIFLVRFICRDEGQEVIYTWSTAEYTKIPVLESLNNGTEIVEEYSDILEEWRRSLVTSWLEATDRAETAAKEAKEALDEIKEIVPEDFGDLVEDVEQLKTDVNDLSDDIENLIDIEDKPDVEIPTMADIVKKTEKVQIDYYGNNTFKIGDRVLNFADIYNYHLVRPDFTFIVYGNRAYLCSFVNVPASGMKEMRFDSVIISDLRVKVSSIYIISNDGVSIVNTTVSDINNENSSNKVNEITDAYKASTNHYPSTKAVALYVDTAVGEVIPTDGNTGDVLVLNKVGDTASLVWKSPDELFPNGDEVSY